MFGGELVSLVASSLVAKFPGSEVTGGYWCDQNLTQIEFPFYGYFSAFPLLCIVYNVFFTSLNLFPVEDQLKRVFKKKAISFLYFLQALSSGISAEQVR